MGNSWNELFAAALGDAVGYAVGPVGNTAGAILGVVLKGREDRAAKIALEEFRKGRSIYPPDDTAAMLFRYLRAAQEGAARTNLRLMAKIMAGQNEEKPLAADEFLYWAEMISSLKREEIILLATLLRSWSDLSAETDHSKRMSSAYHASQGLLVPKVFSTRNDMSATMAALTRTGLIFPGTTIGSFTYQISPLLERLNALASLEAVVSEES